MEERIRFVPDSATIEETMQILRFYYIDVQEQQRRRSPILSNINALLNAGPKRPSLTFDEAWSYLNEIHRATLRRLAREQIIDGYDQACVIPSYNCPSDHLVLYKEDLDDYIIESPQMWRGLRERAIAKGVKRNG
jgi:hypothetical protein